MDHELKQRLIGAVVVTALCAIFIPMLFDDPVETNGELVSELKVPAPTDTEAGVASKLPTGADQVLKLPDAELSSNETAGDTLESTGAEEEAAEPEVGQLKPGHSGDGLYAESAGYTQKGAAEEPAVDEAPKAYSKQSQEAASGKSSLAEVAKSLTPKTQGRVSHSEVVANEAVKIKKATETVKPSTVKKPEKIAGSSFAHEVAEGGKAGIGQPVIETLPVAGKEDGVKQSSAAKSLAASVAEAKKPSVVPPKVPSKLVRWYIQVGSFSKKDNAMSLWDSLRDQGLPASLDTVQTDKGTAYRLRVGPELDEKKAAAMKSRLDKQNIKAILISE
jgi:DedD protein